MGYRHLAWVGTVGLVLVAACVANPPRRATECDPVPGAESLLRPGVVLLLGEIHGTQEAPAAVAGLVCAALNRGLGVTVGLEIPHVEQGVADAYLASSGAAEDQKLLLASAWWQRDYQDGRSSAAMFDLIRDLRVFAADAKGVRVILIDDPMSQRGRDAAMATRVEAAIDRRPRDLLIVLTGNVHNRLTPGRTEPMGLLLKEAKPGPEIISLNITHAGGTAWVCTSGGCGVLNLRGEEAIDPGVELFPPSGENPYTGRLHVGGITASPPARAAAVQPAGRDGGRP